MVTPSVGIKQIFNFLYAFIIHEFITKGNSWLDFSPHFTDENG
ncbi:hypothetical protein E9Y_03356 [Moraxella catarrhalis 101P30B1]|jgi:hypothetical protein|nr:hypothetical protein E9K_07782 [Moraxella catarrhalis 103P14B1]EGE25393.1 hypothetical protein E9Y_03356 [Moraxella catarrhalis 101P30B1]